MRKLYFRLGLLIGFVGVANGLTGLLMALEHQGEFVLNKYIAYVICFSFSAFVIIITLLSTRNPAFRYWSKQFQVTILYIAGTLSVLFSENTGGHILFLLAIMLAFRFSYLHRMTLLFTLIYDWILILTNAWMYGKRPSAVLDEVVFLGFAYLVVYIVYSEYSKFLKKRLGRLNRELDMAKRIIPFGAELRKKLRSEIPADSDLTRKEYEVMVAICVHEKLTNDELADFLGVSIATVKSHLNNIYRKTGIHNRSRLIAVYKDLLFERRGK